MDSKLSLHSLVVKTDLRLLAMSEHQLTSVMAATDGSSSSVFFSWSSHAGMLVAEYLCPYIMHSTNWFLKHIILTKCEHS